MPKPLVFNFGGQLLAVFMSKVDRSKLYGYKEPEMLDEQEEPCELATLAADGRTVIGRGGTAAGYLSVEGHWCERFELTPVDLEGQPIEAVPSSFEFPITLVETVDINEYLNYEIRSVGLETEDAFLLMNDEQHIFMVIGSPTGFPFVGLQTPAQKSEDAEVDDQDPMDFDMI